jgi:hypothetical protein
VQLTDVDKELILIDEVFIIIFQRTTKSIIKCLIRVKVADFSIRVPLNKLANQRKYYKFSD